MKWESRVGGIIAHTDVLSVSITYKVDPKPKTPKPQNPKTPWDK